MLVRSWSTRSAPSSWPRRSAAPRVFGNLCFFFGNDRGVSDRLVLAPWVSPPTPVSAWGGVRASCVWDSVSDRAVSAAQVSSLVWVRNGFGLRTQAAIYETNRFRGMGRDLDVWLVQLVVSLATSEAAAANVVRVVVRVFELDSLFRLDAVSPPLVGEPPADAGRHRVGQEEETGAGGPAKQLACGEEMLRLLICVLSARDLAGDMAPWARWRHCLVHCLAIQDRPHSEILEWAQTCPVGTAGRDDAVALIVDQVLPEIATRVRGEAESESSSGLATQVRNAAMHVSRVPPHATCPS